MSRLQTSRWVGAALVLSLVQPACQDYPFAFRPNRRVAATTVHEVVVRNTDTDILFVVDNSGSMREEQENLNRNTEEFIRVLAASENKYRVGIITTDIFADTDGGRLRMVGSGPPYLDRPDPEDPNVETLRQQLINRFIQTVEDIGVDGNGKEAGLEAARRALDGNAYPDVASHNEGFLRPEADLALIFLTDEDDCSFANYDGNIWQPGVYSNATCYDYRNQGVDPSWYIDFFAGLKANPSEGLTSDVRKVRAALIAGGSFEGEEDASFAATGCDLTTSGPSRACGCWSSSNDPFFCTLLHRYGHPCTDVSGCPNKTGELWDNCASSNGGSCDTNRCEALPCTYYHEFMRELGDRRRAVAFPRGIYEDSICQQEYDQTLRTIAYTVVISSCFNLDEPAMGPEKVRLILRHTDPATGAVTETEVPQCQLGGSGECTDCGQHPQGAWQYVNDKTICLGCGLKKETGDEFVLTVLNEVVGLDDGSP